MSTFRALSVLLTLSFPAMAAPPEHADPACSAWFQAQRLPGASIPCCDVSDGRAVEVRYRAGGKIEAFVPKTFPHCDIVPTPDARGAWLEIPEARILHGAGNPTGRAVLWWTPWYGVLCFSLPPET